MSNKYLKPMLDTGSPRVYNCNDITQRILAADPEAPCFFRSKQLNAVVLIKDTVPEADRRGASPPIGTKLYFPFNEKNIYEGGRTIFLHDQYLSQAIIEYCGEGALSRDALAEDLRILGMLDRVPSLDPFLLKDYFIRNDIKMNPSCFDVSEEAWREIETFMLQRFEPLVKAAFPDAMSSDEKARLLIDKMWEARDLDALKPLIHAFRLPESEALDIFSAWRGIVYYSYQYQCEQPRLVELIKWLKENDGPVAGVTAAETRDMAAAMTLVKDQLRREWQTIEEIVRDYQTSYDKMFKLKVSSADFLSFLKGSSETYWRLGNSLGKTNHGAYCWDVMTKRFDGRKLPWVKMQEVMHLLATVFQPEKKTTTSMSW